MEYKELLQYTIQLLQFNEELQTYFDEVKESGETPDFYKTVKPYADRVRDALEKWESFVVEWIAEEKPKYFYKQQVENLKENITTVSVQAFYPSASRKRVKELIRSNQYTLEAIVQKLEN